MTRTEWLKLPIAERANWLANTSFLGFDRYLMVQKRLWRRFSRGAAGVIIDVGGKPGPYRVLEDQAWMKYVVNA